MKRKVLLVVTILSVSLSSLAFGQSISTVTVSLPDFPVILNGTQMNPEYSEYPVLKYKGITYVPMTYNLSQSLGLQASWSNTDGLEIMTTTPNGIIEEYSSTDRNNSSLNASIPDYHISVNGKDIDNSKEEYPVLAMNGISYFPLTWRFVVDEFNWNMTYNDVSGLKISSNIAAVAPLENTISSQADDKNIYTQEYLQSLVDSTSPDQEITDFRSQPNPRRNDQLKFSGKYFDIYYPDGEDFQRVADLLKPHMDKAYMMLVDLYGYQARVEVHIIDPSTAETSEEGDIRADEHVTFIWMEEGNDGIDGVNNIAELVHEMNHNFFEEDGHIGAKQMWLNEANAKLIASLYTEYLDEDTKKNIQQYSFYDPVSIGKDLPSIVYAEDNYLVSDDGSAWDWYPRNSEEDLAQLAGLTFWWNVYNQNSLDTFKEYLRQLTVNEPSLSVMERITGLSKDELNDKYMIYK